MVKEVVSHGMINVIITAADQGPIQSAATFKVLSNMSQLHARVQNDKLGTEKKKIIYLHKTEHPSPNALSASGGEVNSCKSDKLFHS